METKIGEPNDITRTVPVTFTQGDIVHTRDVNACYDADGVYDPAATEERIAQVAMGVAHKIAVGAIREVEPVAAPTEEGAEPQATVAEDGKPG